MKDLIGFEMMVFFTDFNHMKFLGQVFHLNSFFLLYQAASYVAGWEVCAIECSVKAWFFKAPFFTLLFSCYALITFLIIVSVTLLSILMILLSTLNALLSPYYTWIIFLLILSVILLSILIILLSALIALVFHAWMIFFMILSVIMLSILMILLSTLNVISLMICGNSFSWLLMFNLMLKTLWFVVGSGLLNLILVFH